MFDVKIDVTHKDLCVLNDCKKLYPMGFTRTGTGSRDSARITFTRDALNGVDLFVTNDISTHL